MARHRFSQRACERNQDQNRRSQARYRKRWQATAVYKEMVIVVETLIPAPPADVYDALLDPQIHAETSSGRERVIDGPSPLKLGAEVTFEATHFGVRQRLTARITLADPPFAFEDTMTKGAFRRLHHRHEFHTHPEGCRMVDRMEFASPLGSPFDRWVLGPYLQRFLVDRGEALAKRFKT